LCHAAAHVARIHASHVVYFRGDDNGDIGVVRILGKLPELHFDPLRDDEAEEDEQG